MEKILIERFRNNLLLEPDNVIWRRKNIFNCGVIIDDDGLYKMLFRGACTANQSESSCGLAVSADGLNWYMLDKPVLQSGYNKYCEYGIEDPRIVKWIDDYKYVFATACSSTGDRIGIWKTRNFLEYEWIGVLFNQEDKNASILSEPVNGWVYLLHRRPPHIWISRTRDMTLKSDWRDSRILSKKDDWYIIKDKPIYKVGIAGPPLKTPKGWLVITHVVHLWDDKKSEFSYLVNRMYSLGFMVLDLKDPTKIIYIHPEPILVPTTREEIGGAVPNVVFSCATVDTGGEHIYIYWGGADTVICGGRLSKNDLPMCY